MAESGGVAKGPDLDGLSVGLFEQFHLDRLPLDRPNRPTETLLRLDGRRALVTGGGGDGLGYAICHRLAEQGAHVAVVDVRLEAARETADEVARRYGVPTVSAVADVGNWQQAQDAVATVVEQFGGLDLLVNNAGGGMSATGDLVEVSYEELDAILRLNLYGVIHMTKAAIPGMLAAGSGRVINIASEAGRMRFPGAIAYATAKAAVLAFTRTLAAEFGPRGVTAVAVCPGTMIASRNVETLRTASPKRLARLALGMDRTTIDRCSLPDEVASMVAFLASDAGSYVHGTAVSVGGGQSDTV